MSEQSLDSLFGTLSTKVPLTSDAPKTSNASIQTNQGENGFHASLMNSMKDASADDNQTDLFSSSDTNNEQDINQIGDMASLGLSNNNIGGSQVKLQHDIHQSITTEAITNFITNNSTDGNSTPAQSQASILSDNFLLNDKSKTPNEPGSNLSKVFKDATIPVSENVKTKQSNLEGKSSLIKIAS